MKPSPFTRLCRMACPRFLHTKIFSFSLLVLPILAVAQTEKVNPFLGTATLWTAEDLGYTHTENKRAWGGEVFPGASLPNAMVQCTPVTMYPSGAGYQYEDRIIYGFAHTAKGHWNLLHLPVLPVSGEVHPCNFASEFSHEQEEAHPGYYKVFLQRYHIQAELTTTLRGAFHRYTFPEKDHKRLLIDITRSNNKPRHWDIHQTGHNTFAGYQDGEGRIYFWAQTSLPIDSLSFPREKGKHQVALLDFLMSEGSTPLEVQFGFSFVSIENAKLNFEKELQGKTFEQVRMAADVTWNTLLNRIRIKGGTPLEQQHFYSCLYRSFLWPALRSDVNGEYTDATGHTAQARFRYYTMPSFWDTYRNKLILLGLLTPDVACDVVMSCIDQGEKRGDYMPTFFHGDHASTFVAGLWTRGIRKFDIKRAYRLLLRNATEPGRGGRPFLQEYIDRGWIAEKDTTNVPTEDEYKAAVTKTVEYAYDDYAVSLLAEELRDKGNAKLLRKRSENYKNLFDPSTGFWRGKIEDGSWIKDFDPYYPYYAYMYREANGWQSLFYAPHDPQGMVQLYPSPEAVDQKLDSLFTEPWRGYEAWNFTGFLGNYCHGNQPDHSVPFTYYFIDRQPKSQAILDRLLHDYYGMGPEGLAYAGMDDAGEMSSWYVLTALGLYTYSPADPQYLVSVPLFQESHWTFGDGTEWNIFRHDEGPERGTAIHSIQVGKQEVKGYFVFHEDLCKDHDLHINVGK